MGFLISLKRKAIRPYSAIISIITGSLLSLTVIRAFNHIMECFAYRFTLLPFIGTIPAFVIIAFGVSAIVYRYVRKYSIIERLREE